MKMSSFVGAAISRSFDTLLGRAGTLKAANFNLCNEKLKKQQPQQRELDRRSRKKLFMIRKFMHGLIYKMQIYSDCTHQLTSMISHELHHCAFVFRRVCDFWWFMATSTVSQMIVEKKVWQGRWRQTLHSTIQFHSWRSFWLEKNHWNWAKVSDDDNLIRDLSSARSPIQKIQMTFWVTSKYC